MKKRIKKLLVVALRSDKYKQTIQRLRRGDRFCCLGVLCNLHAQAHPELAAMETDPEEYLSNGVGLPIEVMKWAGLTNTLGDKVSINGLFAELSLHNDNGCTFLEIADAIEEQL